MHLLLSHRKLLWIMNYNNNEVHQDELNMQNDSNYILQCCTRDQTQVNNLPRYKHECGKGQEWNGQRMVIKQQWPFNYASTFLLNIYLVKYYCYSNCVRFEVFTALFLRIRVFWDTTLCHWVSGY